MKIKKIILVALVSPLIVLWVAMLLLSEIFSELELITGELLDKVGKAIAKALRMKT